MNAEIGLLLRATQRDVASAGGLEGLRKLALGNLKLRTVAKESHGSEIRRLAFNHISSGCGNLLASLAKDQVTVYDDSYMQDHLHVAIQYCLQADKHPGGEFAAMCWVSGSRWTRHPFGDAVLAVGGTTGVITVISVVAAQVVAELPVGEGTSVAELASAAGTPGLLVALLGGGGAAQLWDVRSGTCLRTWATDGVAMALHPSGSTLVTTDRAGTLSNWQLLQLASPGGGALSVTGADSAAAVSNSQPLAPDVAAAGAAQEHVMEVDDWQQLLGSLERSVLEVPELGGAALDGLAMLTGDRLLVKAVDGRMWVLQLPTCTTLVTWKVPGFSSGSHSSKRCLLGHSDDGHLVCIGNPHGSSYVYDARSGQQLAVQAAFRVDGPARATAVSNDGRHLLAAVGHGYLFRYEYNSLRAQQEREQQQKQQEAEDQQQLLEQEQQRLQEEAEQLQAMEEAAAAEQGAAAGGQPEAAVAGVRRSAAAMAAGTVDPIEQDEHMTDVVPPPAEAAAAAGGTGGSGSQTPIAATPVAAGPSTMFQHSPGLQNMDLDQPTPAGTASAAAAAAAAAGAAPRQPLSALDVQGSLPGAGAVGAATLTATPQHAGQAAGDGQVPSSSKRQRVEGGAGVSTVQVSPLLFRRTP